MNNCQFDNAENLNVLHKAKKKKENVVQLSFVLHEIK